MEHLIREFLDHCNSNKVTIHCIGDAMIDEYYEVKIERISPEYPVPVMLSQNNKIQKPGGVANVAYQLTNINCNVELLTFNDPYAFDVYDKHNLIYYRIGDYTKLPIKTRFVENGIQVAPRLDVESKNNSKLSINFYYDLQKFLVNKQHPDVILLSDYNKGFFSSQSNLIELYPNSISIVDPKSNDLSKWKGCTIFKPNNKEAFELSGLKDWKDQCLHFVKEINCKSVVITNAGNGIRGWFNGEFFEYLPPVDTKNVKSVIGAGDCFAAFLALASGHGYNPIEASKIAYHAGLCYVKGNFNRPIVSAELLNSKIVKPQDLSMRDFSLAFTNGCFDILHTGHIETLKFAKSKADKLVVAINTDESIRSLKGNNRPIVSLEHRINLLSNLSMVDFVISFDDLTPLEIIKEIKPDYLIKGADYKDKDVIGSEFCKETYFAPFIENYSTSSIIKDKLKQ